MIEFFWKFFKFGAVGFSGLIVDFSITYLCKEIFKIQKYISNSIGFVAAASSNYFLNRIWTFNDNNPDVLIQYTKFIIISIVGLALNNLLIYFFNDRRKLNFYLAKVIAIGIVILWNFGANYLYTFAKR